MLRARLSAEHPKLITVLGFGFGQGDNGYYNSAKFASRQPRFVMSAFPALKATPSPSSATLLCHKTSAAIALKKKLNALVL